MREGEGERGRDEWGGGGGRERESNLAAKTRKKNPWSSESIASFVFVYLFVVG